MARGLPCIGSTVGGITELLEPEELVPPNDVVALEKKIIEVLSDPARMARLSKRNLAIAAGYTESDLRARRLAFYKSLRAGTETWMQNEAVEQQRGLKQVSSSSV
jgi:glycosyltransferase involved in cell wall biosynthesis